MERWNALPCLTLLVLACQGCMMSGGGTEGEGLTGTFVNPQGQPVAGVTVKLYDADDENALSKATSTHEYSDSTVTDASGRYRFSSLGKGRYNLEGISGNGGNAEAIFIPSIKFEGALDLGTDTLHVPGGIRIHIRSNGTPQEGVLCYVPGTSLLAISDDAWEAWTAPTHGRALPLPRGATKRRLNYLIPLLRRMVEQPSAAA